MVLKRFWVILFLPILLLTFVRAQNEKPLLINATPLTAVYPANLGVSYAPAEGFAQALGLGYRATKGYVVLQLGSRLVKLAIYPTDKQAVQATPPGTYITSGIVYAPVKYLAQALGANYSGNTQQIRVSLPVARLLGLSFSTGGGFDRVELRFSRNVNYRTTTSGQIEVLGMLNPNLNRSVTGLYLSAIRSHSSPYGNVLTFEGASSFPMQVYPLPNALVVKVGNPEQTGPFSRTVVIDPAGGDTQTGIQIGALNEATLIFAVAVKMQKRLEQAGYTVRLTRSQDQDPSIVARAAKAVGVAVFVSLHLDGGPVAGNGVVLYTLAPPAKGSLLNLAFVQNGRSLLASPQTSPARKALLSRYLFSADASQQLAKQIASGVASGLGLVARVGEGPYYVLSRSTGAAVLAELGWPQNPTDRTRLAGSTQLTDLADALASGIQAYLGGL